MLYPSHIWSLPFCGFFSRPCWTDARDHIQVPGVGQQGCGAFSLLSPDRVFHHIYMERDCYYILRDDRNIQKLCPNVWARWSTLQMVPLETNTWGRSLPKHLDEHGNVIFFPVFSPIFTPKSSSPGVTGHPQEVPGR